MFRVVEKVEHIWSKFEMFLLYIGAIAMLICMTLITVDVIMRNIFNSSIVGVTELASLLLMPIFTCALPYIQSKKAHIILEFATEKAPPKVQAILDIFGMLVGLVLFAVVAQSCVTSAIDSFVRLDRTAGLVTFYIWPARACLAIVVISMIVRLILSTVLSIRDLTTGPASVPSDS